MVKFFIATIVGSFILTYLFTPLSIKLSKKSFNENNDKKRSVKYIK